MVTVQRTLEMIGIPTTLITVDPKESGQARPPRALCPGGFGVGRSLGKPNDPAFQKRIILDALGLLVAEPRPGQVITREYPA